MNQFVIRFLIFLFPGVVLAQVLINKIETEIIRRVATGINPGVLVGLLIPSGEAKFYNYGSIRTVSKIPAESNTIFEIASVTMTFTAMVEENTGDSLNTDLAEVLVK